MQWSSSKAYLVIQSENTPARKQKDPFCLGRLWAPTDIRTPDISSHAINHVTIRTWHAPAYFRILLPCLLPSWAAERELVRLLRSSLSENPLACTDPSPKIDFLFGAMIKTWCFLALLIALPPLFNSLPDHDSHDAPDKKDRDLEGARLLMQVCQINYLALFRAPCARCRYQAWWCHLSLLSPCRCIPGPAQRDCASREHNAVLQ